MDQVVRFGVSMSGQLLSEFDRLITQKGYETRSEAVRDLVRQLLVSETMKDDDLPALGTVTLLYDHHSPQVAQALKASQHDHCSTTTTALHMHLDADHCFEVIVLRGSTRDVRALADGLISMKGVKMGRFSLTPASPDLFV